MCVCLCVCVCVCVLYVCVCVCVCGVRGVSASSLRPTSCPPPPRACQCPSWAMISGARYSGVPHSVLVRAPGSTCLTKPKSAIWGRVSALYVYV